MAFHWLCTLYADGYFLILFEYGVSLVVCDVAKDRQRWWWWFPLLFISHYMCTCEIWYGLKALLGRDDTGAVGSQWFYIEQLRNSLSFCYCEEMTAAYMDMKSVVVVFCVYMWNHPLVIRFGRAIFNCPLCCLLSIAVC